MAQIPFLVISPNVLVSLYGLVHGPDKTVATPAEDWHKAVVDVVIPTLNEEENIVLCLASVMRQTLRPRKIVLIDDGSKDKTIELAEKFASTNGLDLRVIRRAHSIGKTPGVKRQSREFDNDVEFILDGDTFLESPNYIERTVQELYQAAGIASACGIIMPLRRRDHTRATEWPTIQAFHAAYPEASLGPDLGWWQRLRRGFPNIYRDTLYMFLQKFVYRGQMAMFGTITNPTGCAVAYRRKYVKDLFDYYEPILGDDLTNCEDIFIGFAMLAQGYRNIQLEDVTAHSKEPDVLSLPRQMYMWSSSFLQSCFYFDSLLLSPFKAFKRYLHERRGRKKYAEQIELRKIQEPYRQAWGLNHTLKYGRPIGWTLFMSAIEKVFYPVILLALICMGWWKWLGITVGIEATLMVLVLGIVAKGQRLEYIGKGILTIPLRYLYLAFELVTFVRFAVDLWFRRNRKWRK